MAAETFKVKIESAIMFVRKVKLSPSIFLAHAEALENSTAKYPINPICRVVCNTVTVSNVFRDAGHENMFSVQLPS